MFRKIIKHKNTAGKISALLCLILGAALFILSGSGYVAVPALAQAISIGLLVAAIYIASVFLLREYTYAIEPNIHVVEDNDLSKQYDLIVTELKGRRQVKVCHIEMSDVKEIRIITPENKKTVKAERKGAKCYTYDTRFAPNLQVEIKADIDGEDYSIILSYDEDFIAALRRFKSF
jgi:hypothetical protein